MRSLSCSATDLQEAEPNNKTFSKPFVSLKILLSDDFQTLILSQESKLRLTNCSTASSPMTSLKQTRRLLFCASNRPIFSIKSSKAPLIEKEIDNILKNGFYQRILLVSKYPKQAGNSEKNCMFIFLFELF